MSLPCDAGLQGIQNKKLCSPIICKKFENQEIPQSDEFNRKQKIFSKNLKNKHGLSQELRQVKLVSEMSSVMEEFDCSSKENIDVIFNYDPKTLPTYQTTKVQGATSQTIGTGFVTAIDTYTYDNE